LKNVNDDIYEFDIINYKLADQGVRDFLKYLANFIFYRFGLEVKKQTDFYFIKIKKNFILWLDLLYNNSYCCCYSSGYRSCTLCSLAWNIFNIY